MDYIFKFRGDPERFKIAYTMEKDNQEIKDGAILDMASQDPHVTVDCPVCDRQFMKKVELNVLLYTACECKIAYYLRPGIIPGMVDVEMHLTPDQYKKRKW